MINLDYLESLPARLAIRKDWHLGVRPLCPCCGGGKIRKGYRYCKAKSRRKSLKAKGKYHDQPFIY